LRFNLLEQYPGLNFKIANFCSSDPRIPRREDESTDILKVNNQFSLPFVIPNPADRRDKRANGDVIIVVNGYNQFDGSLPMYFSDGFGICTLLKRRGYTSVLLPIPFHLWRTPEVGIFTEPMGPRINNDQMRFYLGYRQLLADIDALSSKVIDHEIVLPFDVKRIHLLGYSLGGLGTLAAFTLDRRRANPLFSSCTVLFSGASLKNVDARGTGVTKAEIAALRKFFSAPGGEFLRDAKGQLQKIEEQRSGRLSAFKYFVLGQSNRAIRDILVRNIKRIPVIIGQDDPVMPFAGVMKFIPSAARHRLVDTVPGVGHFLWREKNWKNGGARRSLFKLAFILDKLK
jgi:pimeloyl-ACP methyl ester carboxylesterase